MGNCPKCDEQMELSFNYEDKDNVINFTLIKTENSNISQNIILDNIKNKDLKFLEILNKIIKNIEKIKESKIIVLKEAIESILLNILSKEDINLYLTSIDKYIKNKYDNEAIVKISEMFKLIYSKKKEIKRDDIKYLIKSINIALTGTEILNELLFKYFFEKMNTIFYDDIEKDENKKSEKERIEIINNVIDSNNE